MAQSRPHASRTHTTPSSSHYTTSNSRASSPNPLSPRTHSHHHGSEKRHHTRRKSGRTDQVTTSSDRKSSSRPGLTRKQTPQYASKSSSERRSHREDRDRDDDRRDSGECFAQFWYVQAVFCHFPRQERCGGRHGRRMRGSWGKDLLFSFSTYAGWNQIVGFTMKIWKTCMKGLSVVGWK